MNDAIHWRTAVEKGRLIRSGALTSRDVTEAHLDRIAALNPTLQAYVTVTAELARQQADASDEEIAAGHSRGPLQGVPYCLKDIIETAGIRTTVGSTILADWVPTRDGTVVRRMRNAGAVLFGKVNTHEFAFRRHHADDSRQHAQPLGFIAHSWRILGWIGRRRGGRAGAALDRQRPPGPSGCRRPSAALPGSSRAMVW